MAAYKTYLKYFICFFLILCTTLLCNYILIIHAYENIPYKEIVELQQQTHAIWGSALNPHTVSYKYELFKHKKPDIITLGSSLSYEYRQEFFTHPFISCGGVMPFLKWGRIFLQEITKFHKPHVVILTIDFWTFNDKYPKADSNPSFNDRGTDYLMYKLRQPFLWLWQGKLTLADYFNILIFKKNRNELTNYNNMGVLAIKRSDGFRVDGSYSYASLVSGFHKAFNDRRFESSLRHIEKSTGQFMYGENLASYTLDELNNIVEICQKQNIKLVAIMPPVAPTVFQRMAQIPDSYKFIGKLQEYLKSLPIEIYDFLNNPNGNFRDSEFIDGFHPGDVADQKMLLEIIRQNPRSVLRDYLNVALMEKSVRENAGKAITVYDKGMHNYHEVDFLEIGCAK